MQKQTVSVRVPATVGNFAGAGDGVALALDASLNVKVNRRLDGHVGIRYFGENGERVPRDRSNLVVRAMEGALHWKQCEFTGADLEIYSSVPVAVGLGSSAAAVLAGMIAANLLYTLGLDERTILELAGVYDHRASNLRAAWRGGWVAPAESSAVSGSAPTAVAYHRKPVEEDVVLSVVVPDRSSAGEGKRLLLDVPVTGLGSGEFGLFEVRGPFLRVSAAAGTPVFVCGSGPAVGVFAAAKEAGNVIQAVRKTFAEHGVESSCLEFRPSNTGALEWNGLSPRAMVAISPALSQPLPTASSAPA